MVVRDTKSANMIIIIIIFCKYNRSVLQFIKYINGYSFSFFIAFAIFLRARHLNYNSHEPLLTIKLQAHEGLA